ncbi:hypothetical protein NOVO_08835 [Rickettsiales bacterium Ac37b]|nr:hypothetical protein NOVO_08835 [Rickettsiales bacterium Ac37b]
MSNIFTCGSSKDTFKKFSILNMASQSMTITDKIYTQEEIKFNSVTLHIADSIINSEKAIIIKAEHFTCENSIIQAQDIYISDNHNIADFHTCSFVGNIHNNIAELS